MKDERLPWPPCPVMTTGKTCDRTDDRPTVLDPILGVICLSHRPAFASKPKADPS